MDSKILNWTDDPARNPRYEFRRCKVSTAELARLYFEEMLPLAKIGDKVGISLMSVSSRLKRAGHVLRGHAGGHCVTTPTEKLISMYFDERLSTVEIGGLIGISPETVARRIRQAGRDLRGNEVARHIRTWKMSAEERSKTFGGMNRLLTQAIAREKGAPRRKKIPPNEIIFQQWFADLGFPELIAQKAVGIYNVDFASGSIAIEIGSLRSKAQSFAACAERIYSILKAGFNIIELMHGQPGDDLKKIAVDQVIAVANLMQSLPPHIREYRVIGGSGQTLAIFKADLNDIP